MSVLYSRGSSAVPNYVSRIYRAVAYRCLSLVFAAGSSGQTSTIRGHSAIYSEIYRDLIIRPDDSSRDKNLNLSDDETARIPKFFIPRIITKYYILFHFTVNAAVLRSLESNLQRGNESGLHGLLDQDSNSGSFAGRLSYRSDQSSLPSR